MEAKSERRMTSFRFDESTFGILKHAGQATGMTMTEIIERCIRGYLPSLLEDVSRERQQAASDLDNYFDSMNTEEEFRQHMSDQGKPVGKRSRADKDALKMAKVASDQVKKKRKKKG